MVGKTRGLSYIVPVLVAFAGLTGLGLVACGSSESPAPTQSPGALDPSPSSPAQGNRGVSQTPPTTSGDAPDAGAPASPDAGATRAIKTVFLVMLENHSWPTIKNDSSAVYINKTLVAQGAHAEQYFTPPHNHPSEPNYIWLEAGDSLGIINDNDPSKNHQATKDHLSAQLEAAGISWKAYAEDISGTGCPLTRKKLFGTKHTPQLFFDDMTDGNSPTSKHCEQHVRPYAELEKDLQQNTVARYNFITPNLCNDMHGDLTCPFGMVGRGDSWLARELPKIMSSQAYKDGGVLFVLWDEGDEPLGGTAEDGPIPLFVLSPFAKAGYASNTKFTHSSTLRTLETIFGVPYLRGAQTSNDLSEMFTTFP